MPTQEQLEWMRLLGRFGETEAGPGLSSDATKPVRTSAQIKAEFAKVYATTSVAETDAWLEALGKEVAGEPELESLARRLRELVLERRAARAKARETEKSPAGAEPAGSPAEPSPMPPSAAPGRPDATRDLFDEVQDAGARALAMVERLAGEARESVRDAWRRWDAPEASTSRPPAAPEVTASQPDGPEFKGYPRGLEAGEKLIAQVKRYGFSEGIHATSADADDRADVEEIWCSGLSNWSLLESGIAVDEKYGYPTGRSVKDPKSGAMVPEVKQVSIREVVEGGYGSFGEPPRLERLPTKEDHPDPDELKAKIEETKARNKAAREKALKDAYAQDGLFGEKAAEDDPRVKGAAGAFVIAKIGTEILDLKDVKPGDFCQTRVVRSPTGHAYQIHACECVGEALIGPAGSPKLIKDLGGERIPTRDGVWYGNARFKIDGRTDPAWVGKHEVVKLDILESNVRGAMEDKKAKPQGGVQIDHDTTFPDPLKTGKRTYVGRLSSSSWAGFVRTDPRLKRPEAATPPDGR